MKIITKKKIETVLHIFIQARFNHLIYFCPKKFLLRIPLKILELFIGFVYEPSTTKK